MAKSKEKELIFLILISRSSHLMPHDLADRDTVKPDIPSSKSALSFSGKAQATCRFLSTKSY
jgi:hypothetical protein